MKTSPTTHSARRIPAARLVRLRATNAVKRQAREDAAAQLMNPTPEFETAPRLTMLPRGLHWSNQALVPAIGATVTVNRDGHAERAEVQGYCHAASFLELVTETTHHARSGRRKGRSPRARCVFGS